MHIILRKKHYALVLALRQKNSENKSIGKNPHFQKQNHLIGPAVHFIFQRHNILLSHPVYLQSQFTINISLTNIKSSLSIAISICSNIISISLLRLPSRVSPAVLKARSMVLSSVISVSWQADRRNLLSFKKLDKFVLGEWSTLSGNCATNCEFQLQLAHLQLRLQLQLGKISYLINYNYNYLNK